MLLYIPRISSLLITPCHAHELLRPIFGVRIAAHRLEPDLCKFHDSSRHMPAAEIAFRATGAVVQRGWHEFMGLATIISFG